MSLVTKISVSALAPAILFSLLLGLTQPAASGTGGDRTTCSGSTPAVVSTVMHDGVLISIARQALVEVVGAIFCCIGRAEG
jgi:hypothetical protein